MSGTVRELAALIGPANVLPGTSAAYLADATEARGLKGTPRPSRSLARA